MIFGLTMEEVVYRDRWRTAAWRGGCPPATISTRTGLALEFFGSDGRGRTADIRLVRASPFRISRPNAADDRQLRQLYPGRRGGSPVLTSRLPSLAQDPPAWRVFLGCAR